MRDLLLLYYLYKVNIKCESASRSRYVVQCRDRGRESNRERYYHSHLIFLRNEKKEKKKKKKENESTIMSQQHVS